MADRYPVGTRLRHHAGSEWEVVEWIGGPHEDRRIRCVEGTARPGSKGGEKVGSEIVVHGEYVPRSFRVVPLSAEPLVGGAPSTKAGSGAGGEPSEEAVEAAAKAAFEKAAHPVYPVHWADLPEDEPGDMSRIGMRSTMRIALRAAYAIDGRAGDGD